MGRKMKKLTRAGAGALAGVMVFGLAAPLAPLSVEAADEVKNLAIGSTATVNDSLMAKGKQRKSPFELSKCTKNMI